MDSDKVSKALSKFTEKERNEIKVILNKIKTSETKNLDIKKLKGMDDIFRVRYRKIRIIYRIDKDKNIFILAIERRNDNTYKF